ncbi:chemotaxis protein CheA [Sporosarcina sp. HYO08]|uniref:chemotaxis protein CheA n=1 Tax=Sporosarcina sp. HYO08 TaxID=1759557 RepID=UPI000795D829|nr:chemotaxis protein CheA [Sporosarcina sp. HYO08]KXH80001.1 chemotaxis protein CheA [Sporosarcina sp. HYO08]
MDTSQYLEMFIEESKEHLQSCNEQLLALENHPEDIGIVNEIFRSAHTLKGMSATMGYDDIAHLTHEMENILDRIRNEQLGVTTNLLDVVFQSVDVLEEMVIDIASGGSGKKDVQLLVKRLKEIESGNSSIEETAATTVSDVEAAQLHYDEFERTVIAQSLEQGFSAFEIQVELREDCLLKAARVFMVFEVLEKHGEVIKTEPGVEQLENEDFGQRFLLVLLTNESVDKIQSLIQKVSEVEKVSIHPVQNEAAPAEEKVIEQQLGSQSETGHPQPEKPVLSERGNQPTGLHAVSKTIRVNIDRLDGLMNLFEELVIDRGRLQSIAGTLQNPELTETVERMTRVSGDLQSIILNMRMIPIETVFNRFPKMVRQLARELDKKIKLTIVGAETELDRTVIDEIGDPLVHLIRNALDHGIESPAERAAQGKPMEGNITLRAYHSGNHVFIELEDDGAGINREKVLEKAIANGLVSPEMTDSMTDHQVAELILSSGFSTAEEISDVSGRGVGLDVVKTTIESLGGSISIRSTSGQGSLFQVQLPLTLSIISVLLVELGTEVYAVPLSSIIETAVIHRSEVMDVHHQQVIDFRGSIVPIVFLKDIFDLPREQQEDDYYSVVIIRKGDQLAALVVDSFIGQQEIVLKSLGNYLQSIFAVSGATILGNGQVALIVDYNALIK